MAISQNGWLGKIKSTKQIVGLPEHFNNKQCFSTLTRVQQAHATKAGKILQ
jgi:hypothetical protein